MKTIFFRIILVCAAFAIGAVIYLSLTFAGDKSKGPLDDLLTGVNSNIAGLEKQMTGTRESRSESLSWFNKYRSNTALLNNPDTTLFGAYDDRTAESYEPIVALEDSIQTKLPIISFYTAWGSKRDQVFPLIRAQAVHDLGSIPMITWEPWLDDFNAAEYAWNANAPNKNKRGMKAVAEGEFDTYIDKWASDARKFGHPFFLRFGHEMNDPYRYPWGPQNNSPEDFINAWRHIRERFKQIGATNAIWVWSPHPAYLTYPQFYPGHEYVDWIGLTALNYGTVAPWSQWWSFTDIIQNSYKDLSLYNKPIMLTEFGCLEVGGDRAGWFEEALSALPTKFPAVKGVVFFHTNSDNTTTYKVLDWSFKNDKKVTKSISTFFINE